MFHILFLYSREKVYLSFVWHWINLDICFQKSQHLLTEFIILILGCYYTGYLTNLWDAWFCSSLLHLKFVLHSWTLGDLDILLLRFLLWQDFTACTTLAQSVLASWNSLQTEDNTVLLPVLNGPRLHRAGQRRHVLVSPIWQTLSLCIYLPHNSEVLLQLNVFISAWAFQCDDSNHHKNDVSYIKYLKNGFTAYSWVERFFRDSRSGIKEQVNLPSDANCQPVGCNSSETY